MALAAAGEHCAASFALKKDGPNAAATEMGPPGGLGVCPV